MIQISKQEYEEEQKDYSPLLENLFEEEESSEEEAPSSPEEIAPNPEVNDEISVDNKCLESIIVSSNLSKEDKRVEKYYDALTKYKASVRRLSVTQPKSSRKSLKKYFEFLQRIKEEVISRYREYSTNYVISGKSGQAMSETAVDIINSIDSAILSPLNSLRENYGKEVKEITNLAGEFEVTIKSMEGSVMDKAIPVIARLKQNKSLIEYYSGLLSSWRYNEGIIKELEETNKAMGELNQQLDKVYPFIQKVRFEALQRQGRYLLIPASALFAAYLLYRC